MFEQSHLMFLYSITPIHMGAGQATGVIDNPIQRERHTNHPNVAGSGLKGAIRHHLSSSWEKTTVTRIFGPESSGADHAGAISFGDAQIIAFPVRSLKQGFVYAVSRVSLARLKRLANLAGVTANWEIPSVSSDQCHACDEHVLSEGKLILEAFEFTSQTTDKLKSIAQWIASHSLPQNEANNYFRNKIETDLVLLPDNAFSHFVENSTVVEPHVRINNETGTADGGALFYTENLPPESLMVAPVFSSVERYKNKPENKMGAHEIMQAVKESLNNTLLQIGGNATTGRGQVIAHFAGEE